jgi:hypothetical protein
METYPKVFSFNAAWRCGGDDGNGDGPRIPADRKQQQQANCHKGKPPLRSIKQLETTQQNERVRRTGQKRARDTIEPFVVACAEPPAKNQPE